MISPARHIEKARRILDGGRFLLQGGFTEQAGREAYLAAFHAAQAYTVHVTAKEPKTHSGARTEFARLVRSELAISPGFVSFLGTAFEMKTHADYDGDEPVSQEEAAAALATASTMVDVIATLLRIDPSGGSSAAPLRE